jgi:hypothetical protein
MRGAQWQYGKGIKKALGLPALFAAGHLVECLAAYVYF